MIQTIARALQSQRGTGYTHVDLPQSVPHVSRLIGSSGILPASASVRQAAVLPKDQSATNSCVGMSAAQAYRTACLVKGIPCPELSGLFNYKLGRASMGIEDDDIGMSFPGMMAAVERFGMASEAAWSFSLLRVNARPSGSAFHDAYDRRGIRDIYEIDGGDAQTVRQALARGVPIIGAWDVDRSFQQDSGPVVIDVITGDIIGSHAMVVEDYQADGTFGVLNHYGPNWRDNGRARFTEAELKKSHGFIVFDVGS